MARFSQFNNNHFVVRLNFTRTLTSSLIAQFTLHLDAYLSKEALVSLNQWLSPSINQSINQYEDRIERHIGLQNYTQTDTHTHVGYMYIHIHACGIRTKLMSPDTLSPDKM